MSKIHRYRSGLGEISHLSLVDEILEIARYQISNDKSKIWFENLTCLWTNTNHPNVLQVKRGLPYGYEDDNFIAVSDSSEHTPGLECDRHGRYTIINGSGRYVRRSKVRDDILYRILRYARHKNVCRLWIDQECSPEKDSSEKQTTMYSMDVLYRRSKHPIGLLAVILETQDEVNFLQTLMVGDTVIRECKDDYPRLACPVESCAMGVFDVLVRLHTDRWWTRAWIFQEEYLSSTSMQILIRHKQGIAPSGTSGSVEGEVCLNAVEFCTHATLFLLAFKREAGHKFAKKCTKMLKRFGRYDLQHLFQHDAKMRAMSPRIFAAMQRRQVKWCFDLLPIVANSCNYAIRFVSREMMDSGHDLKLCLLTMYLLNGELFRNSQDIRKLPAEMATTNYMQYVSFNEFDPPLVKKRLSYLKACRFHKVSLLQAGLLTEGNLWRVNETSLPSTWPRPTQRSQKNHQTGLKNPQRDYLFHFVDVLWMSGEEFLAARLERYLEADMADRELSPAKRYMNIMARSVVEAMRTGAPLGVASARNSRKACGVFVDIQRSSTEIFTSWHSGIDVDGRWRESHVSLAVRIQDNEGLPLLDAVKWVNGLFFFGPYDKTKVVFRWPHVWTENRPQ
jgi:hypothetical protein